MDNLIKRVEEYKKVSDKVLERRNHWNLTLKQLIYNKLLEIRELLKLDWQVQKVEIIRNLESIGLILNKTSSGITLKTEEGAKTFIKHGGALLFAQTYNGEIVVYCKYPYVEEWVSELDNRNFDIVEPEVITENLIIGYVEKFLDEMIKWESKLARTKIGFRKD